MDPSERLGNGTRALFEDPLTDGIGLMLQHRR